MNRLRLLMVDDDPVVLRAAERFFARRGHDLHGAGSCAAARSVQGPFDGAVLDLDLGDGHGLDLATELLASGTVPLVVFYSGTSATDARVDASALGTFVSKASGLHALLNAVEASVREAREAALAAGCEGSPLPRLDPRMRSGPRRKK